MRVTIVTVMLVLGSTAAAEEPSRHAGLYLRPEVGVAYRSTSIQSATTSGPAGIVGIAVGGTVRNNLILALCVVDNYSESSNDKANFLAVGPEITYYFEPSNVYLTAALTLTALTRTVNDAGDTWWGPGARIAVGKEWWVSGRWGLGVAAHVSYSLHEATGGDFVPSVTTWIAGVAFSATYN